MTLREKIAHLYRRFGLGATKEELDEGERRGLHPTIESLINYESVEDGFPVSPWEFVFRPEGRVDFNPQNIAAWWALRMVCTKRPLQEKLTLFWHDHFAVSASKVEQGAMMLRYLETLRKHANGNFRALIGAVTKDPAMLRWLDTDLSVKGKPNENYAREVLELFTLGIGNYTERDIQELARAFTGWGLRGTLRGGSPEDTRKQLVECVASERPIVASTYSEDLHDEGPKTILGKTDSFETESVLDHIVSRPQTARYIATKLWEFFAHPKPEAKVVERLAKVFQSAKYEIKPVLRAIAESPEFWSDRCVRSQVKSPVDFTISIVRQLGLGPMALAQRDPNTTSQTPIQGPPAQVAQFVSLCLRRQGMRLLYPPDVAGWDWGEAWVSPAMMAERIRFGDVLFGTGRGTGLANAYRQRLSELRSNSSTESVDAVASILDAPAIAASRQTLVEALEAAGGPSAFERPEQGLRAMRTLAKLIFGMPEYQLC